MAQLEHPREQHGAVDRVVRRGDRGRRDLHLPRADPAGLLARVRLLVGHDHLRCRRPARRAVHDSAAACVDRGATARLPGRHGHRRSIEGRRLAWPRCGVSRAGRRDRRCDQDRRNRLPSLVRHRASRHLRRQEHDPVRRHESVAGAARCRLHRRAEHRGPRVCRRRAVVVRRDSDLLDLVPRQRPGARGAARGRRVACRPGRRNLVHEDPLLGRRGDADRRRVDAVLACAGPSWPGSAVASPSRASEAAR